VNDHDRRSEAIEDLGEVLIETELEVGRHEETREDAKRNVILRAVRIGLGIVVCIAGVFLIVLPGPGMVVLAAGLAILSRDVPFARRLLVNVRARIPENERGEISRPILIGGLIVSIATVSFSLWWWLLR
jgi:Putative transmembrane protein (PGPGW)